MKPPIIFSKDEALFGLNAVRQIVFTFRGNPSEVPESETFRRNISRAALVLVFCAVNINVSLPVKSG